MSQGQHDEPARVILRLPLDAATVAGLHAGDQVALTGPALGARDAAHQRMHDLLAAGESLPFEIAGEIIYYVGPSPAQPGHGNVPPPALVLWSGHRIGTRSYGLAIGTSPGRTRSEAAAWARRPTSGRAPWP